MQEDELTLSIRLPFLSPPPLEEARERLATQKEVEQIRVGFATFLEEQQLVGRRLASHFYSEFYRFLLGYSKIYRFSEDIRKLIKRPGERRLAGRPAIPIPKSRKAAVKQQLAVIYAAVLEIQKKITEWKRKGPKITKDAIRDQLKVEYDQERYPWSRYAFRNVNTLPGKRPDGHRPGLEEPGRWSVPDIAAKWTQDWFYAEYGSRYDLRAIKDLLKRT